MGVRDVNQNRREKEKKHETIYFDTEEGLWHKGILYPPKVIIFLVNSIYKKSFENCSCSFQIYNVFLCNLSILDIEKKVLTCNSVLINCSFFLFFFCLLLISCPFIYWSFQYSYCDIWLKWASEWVFGVNFAEYYTCYGDF